MSRPIDADKLLEKQFFSLDDDDFGMMVVSVTDIISAPTVERKKGRWIVNVEFNNGERVIATCSNCKANGEVRTDRNEWGIWHIDSPYCPNCGADMRGDGDG